jgi:hypothetical protein
MTPTIPLRLCEKKKEKRNSSQSRKGLRRVDPQFCGAGCKDAKPVGRGGKSNRAHHNFFASLRLCAIKKIRRDGPLREEIICG